MAGVHEKMNYLEAIECFLQEFIFANDTTDVLLNKKFNAYEFPGTDFVSVFRFNGIPILPPLMTESRRQEMRTFKRHAVLREVARQEKVNCQDVRKDTGSARPDDVTAFNEPGKVEVDEREDLFRGMANENAKQHLVNMDFRSTVGSDISSCHRDINHPTSDTKFIKNDDPTVEFSKHKTSLGKSQTSTEDRKKSEGFCLQNQFMKKDVIGFASPDQLSVNNVVFCDSQTFSDSGTHSTFSSAVDKSNSSSVTVVMNRFHRPVDCSHPKCSIDSGLCSKDLTTTVSHSAVNRDGSEALDEESYLTSSEDLDRSSDNSMFDVQRSKIVETNSISGEKSLLVGDDDDELSSALDTVPDEQTTVKDGLSSDESAFDLCNEKKLRGQSVEQVTSDEFIASKDSVSSAFSGESNEMIRTVINCEDCKVPSNSTTAELCGKEMSECAGSNDSSCTECGEQTNELNQELSNDTAESCFTTADNLVTEILSQDMDQVCPGFIKGFNLHLEKGDKAENDDDENCVKVEEERDEEGDNERSYVDDKNEDEAKAIETEEEGKEEEAEIRIFDKLNSGGTALVDKVSEKLKESEDVLGNDLALRQQLNPEKVFSQEREDKHELSEEQPEEKELQHDMALVCLSDDKEKKHCLEVSRESELGNNMNLKKMMEQGKAFTDNMKDNSAQQEQAAEEEEKKLAEVDKGEQMNDHVEINADVNDDGLPSDRTQGNYGRLPEEKPADDLDDECDEEVVSLKPLPSHISLEKKVAEALCKLDKYHDNLTVCRESDRPSYSSNPAAVLPTTVFSDASSPVTSGLHKDSQVMPNLLPTFSANTELAPYLVSLLTGDTIENCVTMILADHDSNQVPLGYFDRENIQNHESESGNEPVLPHTRIRRNSYVVSSPEVSQITENECRTNDGMRRLRRSSYTLENPSETLQSADVRLDTDPESSVRTTDVNLSVSTAKMLLKTKVNRHNPLLAGEAEQTLPAVAHPEKVALNSEDIGMAAKRARIKSEQVGKLEHLRRYLQQVNDMGTMATTPNGSIQQDERSEMDYMSEGTAGNEVYRLSQVAQTGGHAASSHPRGINSEVVSLGECELTDQSSCDLPVDMNEDQFRHYISQIQEIHRRDLARLKAEQQQLLQREILLHGQRNFRSKKLSTVRSSKQSGSSSRNAVRRSNADVMVACDGSQSVTSVVNCAGDGVDRQCVYSVDTHPQTCKSTVASSALDCGDSRMIESTDAASVYLEQKRTVSPAVSLLSTLQSEDNESEFAFKSPAVLRPAKSVRDSCSPKAPMYSSPASRQRTSFTEVPSSGGNAHNSLAERTDDNAKISSDAWKKLESLPALVKGYLTRRLMRTERVQYIIQTIQDTAMFALHFQMESPMKKGFYSMPDRQLHERVLAQLTAAMYEIHEIFFEIPIKERMTIISQSRALRKEKLFKETRSSVDKKKRMSAATLKAIERKRKAVELEACAKQQPVKCVSNDKSRKSTPDRIPSVATVCQTKSQNDVRPARSQSSPRNSGKENVHRILGKEKTRVVAANTSNKPKVQGCNHCNVKVSKKTTSLAPARKVARKANKQTEENAAVKQLNGYNYDVAQATVKNVQDKKHLNLHQKDTAPSEALFTNNHPKLSPKSNPNYWLNPQVGAVLYDTDDHSPTNSLNESQEKFSRMMSACQRQTVRSYAVQEKDTTRKIACLQSRFS